MAKYVEKQYFPIDIQTLRQGEALPFNLYLLLSQNQRIVRMRKAGDLLEDVLLEHFKRKGLKNLYIAVDEREVYERYLKGPVPIPTGATQIPNISPEELMAIPVDTPEVPSEVTNALIAAEPRAAAADKTITADRITAPPPITIEGAEKMIGGLMSGSESERKRAMAEATKMVGELLDHGGEGASEAKEVLENPTAEHATSVAVYSVLFAMFLGHSKSDVLQDLAIASLLHDVGLTQLPPSVVGLPQTKRNGVQNKLFQAHVNAGLLLLAEMGFKASPRVIGLLTEHHEKFDGTGYPKHLEGFKLEELAQALSLADLVDSLCRGYHDGTTHTMPESLSIISGIEKETTFPHYLNPDVFKKIMTGIKNGSGQDYMGEATQVVEKTKKEYLKAS